MISSAKRSAGRVRQPRIVAGHVPGSEAVLPARGGPSEPVADPYAADAIVDAEVLSSSGWKVCSEQIAFGQRMAEAHFIIVFVPGGLTRRRDKDVAARHAVSSPPAGVRLHPDDHAVAARLPMRAA